MKKFLAVGAAVLGLGMGLLSWHGCSNEQPDEDVAEGELISPNFRVVTVTFINGLQIISRPSGWKTSIPCPALGCGNAAVGKCAVMTDACFEGMCMAKLKAGAVCAEGWSRMDQKKTYACDLNTCDWP